MKDEKLTALWTVQAPIVIDTIEKTGRYIVKKEYIEQKFQETAWVFQEAYGFIASKASFFLPKPEDAESPIWIYKDPAAAQKMSDTYLLKLEVPEAQVTFWDIRNWTKLLNLSYIGINEPDEQKFAADLERFGIKDNSEIFSTSFYPIQKNKVRQSWNRLFEQKEIDPFYVHGMLWEIKKEWIKKQDHLR